MLSALGTSRLIEEAGMEAPESLLLEKVKKSSVELGRHWLDSHIKSAYN